MRLPPHAHSLSFYCPRPTASPCAAVCSWSDEQNRVCLHACTLSYVPTRCTLTRSGAHRISDRTTEELSRITTGMAKSLHERGVTAPIRVRVELFDETKGYHAAVHKL